MKLEQVTYPETNVAELEISIDGDVFSAEVTKIFRKKAPAISVPGFRKGKAPRNIIEKMYGKGMFYEEALNELLPSAIDEAVSESGIDPVSRADLDIKSIDENGVLLTAKFFTKPEVKLVAYKGIAADKQKVSVADSEVDAEIERARARNARSISVSDRPARKDDTVIFDFEGFLDGIPFEGGKAEKHSLKLGSGQFIPGFEEQIEGKSIGESFNVKVDFPEDYHSEDLKGKPAEFKCIIHEINYEELPELDDDFAGDISEFDTFEEYKADVRSKLEGYAENSAQAALEEKLIDGLLSGFEADIPQVMIDEEINNQIRDFGSRLQSQGLNVDSYMQYAGLDAAAMKERFSEGAQRQVKTRLALEYIVKAENIEPTEEEINEEYNKIAENYGMKPEDVRERLNAENIKSDLSLRKAVDIIKDTAVVTEKTKEEMEKDEEKNTDGETEE